MPAAMIMAPSIAHRAAALEVGAFPPTDMTITGASVGAGVGDGGSSSLLSPRTATANVPGRLLVVPHARHPYSRSNLGFDVRMRLYPMPSTSITSERYGRNLVGIGRHTVAGTPNR